MLRIAWPDDHPTCGIRLELVIRACDDLQRETTELDRLDGAPPAK